MLFLPSSFSQNKGNLTIRLDHCIHATLIFLSFVLSKFLPENVFIGQCCTLRGRVCTAWDDCALKGSGTLTHSLVLGKGILNACHC